MESTYGEALDDPTIVKGVVRSLATLAYADKPRAKFGRQQLIAALKILQRGDISVSGLTGSWAGAMGHTQFIPTTYEAYAVDFDGDGRRDIWNSPVDALASTANYLAKAGWVTGATWGYEVALPAGFNYRLAKDGKSRSIKEWMRLGVKRVAGKAFPQTRRQGGAPHSRRLEWPRLPDAPEPLRHQALQQFHSLFACGRPSRGPADGRRRVRAALAERRAAADRRRRWRNCSDISPRPAIMTARSTASSARRRARRFAPIKAAAGWSPTAFAGVQLLKTLRSG